MVVRHCSFTMPDGQLCRAAPLVKGNFCYLHEPAKATEAAESRRLGGLRRRRENTIAQIYDLEGLDTVAGILRLLDIAATDTLNQESSTARSSVLVRIAMAAAKLLTPGEYEASLRSLGLGVGYKHRRDHEVRGFEDDPDSGEPSAMGRGAPEGRLVKVGDSFLPEAVVRSALREMALAMAAGGSATGLTKPAPPASTGSKMRRRRPPPSGG
jgi:hypothetical protein